MYLLAIDTATNSGGVALARNEEVIGVVMLKTPLRYSDNLIPMIDFLLHHSGVALSDLGALAVANGPGSFTGLRIGLATVKALGQALKIPAVPISTLEALAWRFSSDGQPVAVMIDARRQQVFAAAYGFAAGRPLVEAGPVVARPEKWLTSLPARPYRFAGDGSSLYRNAIQGVRPEARVLEADNQILDPLCRLGFRLFGEGKAVSVDRLEANYVRPSDAELGLAAS